MTNRRISATSQLDDAAQLEFGRYVNDLSDRASQVELLLQRLAHSVPRDDPRLQRLYEAAKKLVEELVVAASSKNTDERDLAVRQLVPHRAYLRVFAHDDELQRLPEMLTHALFDPGVKVTVVEYTALATAVETLNTTLQRQADEAVIG